MPPFILIFSATLISGTLLSISRRHWLYIWAGLEINILSYLAILQFNPQNQTSEAATKYFISQSVGSILFLCAGISFRANVNNHLFTLIIIRAIIIKLGMAPFHFWLPPVISSLAWTPLIIIMAWQKMAPILILFNLISWRNGKVLIIIGAISLIVGAIGGIGQSQIRPILAFSSIRHIGWIASISMFRKPLAHLYLVLYISIITPILFLLKSINASSLLNTKNFSRATTLIILALTLLSIGGIPPFSGFILKWISIQVLATNIPFVILTLIVIISLCNLYYYLNILYSLSLTSVFSPVPYKVSKTFYITSSIPLTLIFSINLVLIFIL